MIRSKKKADYSAFSVFDILCNFLAPYAAPAIRRKLNPPSIGIQVDGGQQPPGNPPVPPPGLPGAPDASMSILQRKNNPSNTNVAFNFLIITSQSLQMYNFIFYLERFF